MVPLLTTEPPVPLKRRLPARKSESLISRVEATNPATLICALEPMTMPFGLVRKTCPFDCSEPLIEDELGPVTRLRVTDAELGWLMRVVSPAAMLNAFQLMIVPPVPVLTVRVEPEPEIVAEPL